ncbi:hypothetical protein DFA_08412 [Cavenderia fasciculata]|uniref:FNIP repeat-containing protein n=1 Tax=Cavenderia fasciculata TaxID=261658 RepID=F4Q608_CACFS|nr:uncharacterized protein DFA_08412 [Cavenderia fasciculata]EGG17417.1 hypothetical protein DFA_08412 [Cavenderia fasciculata]|eukprot:XP_004355901.1 hypothetical protein DFA_08412 [Cavenderia fasciculata]
MTNLLKLSHLILLQIITDIDSNADIIYIYENSISDHQVVLTDRKHHKNYPQWIKQRITTDNRVDKSNITTAFVSYGYQVISPQSLYSMPSLETLFIYQGGAQVDLGSISLLPNLQQLEVCAKRLILGTHTTLKSLKLDIDTKYSLIDLQLTKLVSLTELTYNDNYFDSGIGTGVFPSSLTSLYLTLQNTPPRDTFLSLTSLVNLEIHQRGHVDHEEEHKQHKYIDLETLCNLKSLTFRDYRSGKRFISLNVPPSIKTLVIKDFSIYGECVEIPHRCTMPMLEKLKIRMKLLTEGRISLMSSPSIKKLSIYNYKNNVIPAIPSTLEKLKIEKSYGILLGQTVLPPFLKHLSVIGGEYDPIRLPESLVKLNQKIDDENVPVSLPQHLKSLTFTMEVVRPTNFVFPSNYPPHLETLNFDLSVEQDQKFKIFDIPLSIKYLSVTLEPYIYRSGYFFSISTRIPKSIITQRQQWLPSNTIDLTCQLLILDSKKANFRLDQVINHTNVRYLNIYLDQNNDNTLFQFSIQRLDPNNNNVLVLETQSLQGGIIPQQRKSINTHQHDDPIHSPQFKCIYLHFDVYDTFEVNWSFGHDNEDDGDDESVDDSCSTTATLFKLNSFKDILKNSISDHQVVLVDRDNRYQNWIQQRVSTNRTSGKSNITTALVMHSSQPTMIESLYAIPSIDTLFINHHHKTVDLGAIALLPRLQRLSVRAHKLVSIGQHTTLKSLKIGIVTKYPLADLGLNKFVSLTELTFSNYFMTGIGPDLLPSSLTSLSLRSREIPPRDTFLSLISLVTLEIEMERFDTDMIAAFMPEQLLIDLESLPNLKKFTFSDSLDHITKDLCNLEISVPPTLTILTICSLFASIAPRCTLPKLEKLYVKQSTLIDGRVSLLSCPSIKKLCIYDSCEVMPSNINIPSTLEKLKIYKYTSKEDILGQVVLPPLLKHLTIMGNNFQVAKLPDSLVKLKLRVDKIPISLPQHLKKLSLSMASRSNPKIVLPSPYPPNLETLDLLLIEGDFVIEHMPPITKYLLIPLNSYQYDTPVYSISSILTKRITSQQQQWLPQNTTHLTCQLMCFSPTKVSFRLDEVINHTNVRYLSIIAFDATFQFSIQRLDSDTLNVLVLETKSLQGGIITQQRNSKNNNQQQQQQQYDPIYLSNPNSPLELNWRFSK